MRIRGTRPKDNKRRTDIEALKAAILARLDLRAEFEAMGAQVTGGPRPDGCCECRFRDNDERPSGWFSIESGKWGDSATGDDGSLWDFAQKYGNLGDFWAVIKHFARRAGLSVNDFAIGDGGGGGGGGARGSSESGSRTSEGPGGREGNSVRSAGLQDAGSNGNGQTNGSSHANGSSADKSSTEKPPRKTTNWRDKLDLLDWLTGYQDMTRRWCRNVKPGVTLEAIMDAGGRIARYFPYGKEGSGNSSGKGQSKGGSQIVIAIPGWTVEALLADEHAEPTMWSIWMLGAGMGGTFGKKQHKVLSVGPARGALMGRHGLERILQLKQSANPRDGVVFKTAGPSDLLALYAAIPAELRDRYPVVANAEGEEKWPTAEATSFFAELDVVVIHDCDEAGQLGARRWRERLRDHCDVRRLVLPYVLQKKGGKDLRDWLNEGHTFDQLRVMKKDVSKYDGYHNKSRTGAAWDEGAEKQFRLRHDRGSLGSVGADDEEEQLEVLEAEDDPYRLARVNLKKYRGIVGRELRYWNEMWYRWKDGRYEQISEDSLRTKICDSVKEEFDRLWRLEYKRYLEWKESDDYDPDKDKGPPLARKISVNLIRNVYEATKAECSLPLSQKIEAWIGDGPKGWCVAVENGILNLSSLLNEDDDNLLLPHSPDWFSTIRLPYRFDPTAECPEWKAFLEDVFNGDDESIDALQKWFGYLLTPDNSLQKIMFIIGQARSGKGTIMRVLRAMIGEGNIATPTLTELATQFGLQSLIGKTVAMIPDARISDRVDETAVTERLLSISGDDPQNIQRKYQTTLVGYELKPRFTLFSNLLPRLKDSSSAFITRCIFLLMPNSYVGREDTTLQDRLLKELSGILNWSIAGREMLNESRRIPQPEMGKTLLKELKSIISPVSQFAEEECIIHGDESCSTKVMFEAWEAWCQENDINYTGNIQSFSRKLKAVYSIVDTVQVRDSNGNRYRTFTGIRLKRLDEKIAEAKRQQEEEEKRNERISRERREAGLPDPIIEFTGGDDEY